MKNKMKIPQLENLKKQIEKRTALDNIAKKTNTQPYVVARAIFFEVAMTRWNYTYQVLGRYVNRDHATVINSRRNFSKYMEKLPHFAQAYNDIMGIANDMTNAELLAAHERIEELKRELQHEKTKEIPPTHLELF